MVNPSVVNQELGGLSGYREMSATLQSHAISQMLDIVPNHMAIASPGNPWWWDVLESGGKSEFFGFFDWGWQPPRDNVPFYIPILGDRYMKVVESGEIRLSLQRDGLRLTYGDFVFPIAHHSYAAVMDPVARSAGSERLGLFASLYADAESQAWLQLNARDASGKSRASVLWSAVWELYEHDDALKAAFSEVIEAINLDKTRLHALLEQQHYRLTYWKTGTERHPYRRFFDINTLIGVRIEEERVFRRRHEMLFSLLREGGISGLRVDHIDGLRQPERYLERLRQSAPDCRILVEKILGPGERLPASWPVDGTTGYDVLAQINSLFVDPAGEEAISNVYRDFTGEARGFHELLAEKKRMVLRDLFAGDFNALVDIFDEICQRHADSRDWSRDDLAESLAAFVVALPVYRTYIEPHRNHVSDADRALIEQATATAANNLQAEGEFIVSFIRELMLLQRPGDLENEFILRLQQLTGPLMAKGAEDTTFYSYARLTSLNEVGGEPDRFGCSPDAFHTFVARAAQLWPRGMVSTATHDTKRGEDARIRISQLARQPDAWRTTVEDWSAMNYHLHDGESWDREMEYLLYQAMVGAWPVSPQRLGDYAIKAAREAKRATSWRQPEQQYETTLLKFVDGALASTQFSDSVAAFVAGIDLTARPASIAQLLLKLTLPGVPDLYQGTDLWDYSLVDPDNRRPVDYVLRRTLLEQVKRCDHREAMQQLDSGLPKLWLLQRVLAFRREQPEHFSSGYEPLAVSGRDNDAAVAYLRGDSLAVVAPRFSEKIADQTVSLPRGEWHNVLTGESYEGGEPRRLLELMGDFPAALLVARGSR